jgi:hypothetical protein
VVTLNANAELPKIILALRTPGRLACRLNGRQEQRHQDADDGNHHEQLHKGKTV